MRKFVFTSDKLVNGSLAFKKGIVCEIEPNSITRWVKRGAIEVFEIPVGQCVLDEKGEMPNHKDLLKMDRQDKKDIIEDKEVKDEIKEVKDEEEVSDKPKPVKRGKTRSKK